MKKIKWGIMGLGKIAAKFAEDLQISENSILQGVASREISKAQRFGEKFNSIKHYDSYQALVDDPDIDVIYVATPHVLHYENTMMCLEKNKAVLCEKPIGINSIEVEKMVKEARKRNVFLMEGMWTRFIPSTEKLIELLDDSAIGNIQHITADFGFKAEVDLNGRLFNKKLGGGSLLDVGIYPIYLSLLTLGIPKDVKAMARITDSGVDSYCSMLFNYENESKATLESALESDTPIECNIYGSKGTIRIHSRFHHSEKISLIKDGKEEIFNIKYLGNGYYHEIKEVNQCLMEGGTESKKFPLETSMNLISIIDRVKNEIGLSYKE